MVTKEFFGGRTVRCDNGTEAELLYYLIQESLDGCMGYGVEVIMHREGKRESAAISNVTTSRFRMKELLALLARNTVTPCTLQEVLWEEQHKS